MKYLTKGTVVTDSKLVATDPLIVVDVRIKNNDIRARIEGYTSVEARDEGARSFNLIQTSTGKVLDVVTANLKNIQGTTGESISETLDRVIRQFLTNKFDGLEIV